MNVVSEDVIRTVVARPGSVLDPSICPESGFGNVNDGASSKIEARSLVGGCVFFFANVPNEMDPYFSKFSPNKSFDHRIFRVSSAVRLLVLYSPWR